MIIFLQIIFALSFLGIIFIVFKKIPLLLDYSRHSSRGVSFLEVARNQFDKIKDKPDSFWNDKLIPKTEKFLRRIKIILLKFDNFLAKRTDKLRKKIKKREDKNNLPM